jgi:hypothetical protein
MSSRRGSLGESRINPRNINRSRDERPWRAGGAGRPSNRYRDNYGTRSSWRRTSLEGRRPRRLAATRDINYIETFVPAAGGAGRPSNRYRDNYGTRSNPRRTSLEGRRPRRLAATRDINYIETFVPAVWETARRPSNRSCDHDAIRMIPRYLRLPRLYESTDHGDRTSRIPASRSFKF